MKLVTAVVSPASIAAVKAALRAIGITKVTIIEAAGTQDIRVETYRGSKYPVDTGAKVRIDVVCDLFDAEDVAAVIVASARRGQKGDGAVWITDVDRFIRIRTGAVDMAALQ